MAMRYRSSCACAGLVLTATLGCGRVGFDPSSDATGSPDAPLDDLSTFGTPVVVDGLSVTGFDDDDPELSADQLELYFTSSRFGPVGQGSDVWRAVRASRDEPWGAPALVDELSSGNDETQPTLCCDDLVIYLGSGRAPAAGGADLFIATRPTRDAPWSVPVHVAELSAPGYDAGGAGTRDGLSLVVDTDRTDGLRQLHLARRTQTIVAWSAPVLLDDVAPPVRAAQVDPFLVGDLGLLFSSNRETLDFDLWIALRPALDAAFSPPVPITAANTPADERDPWLAADGRTLYFARRNAAGDYDIMMSTR
jgi:hypothetical protein